MDAASAVTGNGTRDKKMHRQVLLSERFSEIALIVDRVQGPPLAGGGGELTLGGVIRILGNEHEVELPAKVEMNGNNVLVSLEFEVPYVAWGLNDPSKFMLRVDKHVTVSVEARGTLTTVPGPPDPNPEAPE